MYITQVPQFKTHG